MKARPVGNKILVMQTSLSNKILEEAGDSFVFSNRGSLGVVLSKGNDVTKEIHDSDLVIFDGDRGVRFSPPDSNEDHFLLSFDAIYGIVDSGTPEDAFEKMRRRVGVATDE